MKKKIIKIAAIVVLVAFVCIVLFFANAFFGNPVSKALATSTAEKHLTETYKNTDYYIDGVRFNFKTGDYHAFIKSPSSIDTKFSLYLTMWGKLRLDTYDDVVNRFTTAQRLDTEYRELAEAVFKSEKFPYSCSISFGSLEIHPEEYIDSGYDDIPGYAINQKELELDKIYDVNELGRRAGKLVIYVDSDTVTAEKAAEAMLEIKSFFDAEGVSFAALDFVLQHPKPEEGMRSDEEVRVENFLYGDINEDNLTDRVVEADRVLREKYEMMDKESEKLS